MASRLPGLDSAEQGAPTSASRASRARRGSDGASDGKPGPVCYSGDGRSGGRRGVGSAAGSGSAGGGSRSEGGTPPATAPTTTRAASRSRGLGANAPELRVSDTGAGVGGVRGEGAQVGGDGEEGDAVSRARHGTRRGSGTGSMHDVAGSANSDEASAPVLIPLSPVTTVATEPTSSSIDPSGTPYHSCPHVAGIHVPVVTRSLSHPTMFRCDVCNTREDVWICLRCGHFGCGREVHQHALHHYQAKLGGGGGGDNSSVGVGGGHSDESHATMGGSGVGGGDDAMVGMKRSRSGRLLKPPVTGATTATGMASGAAWATPPRGTNPPLSTSSRGRRGASVTDGKAAGGGNKVTSAAQSGDRYTEMAGAGTGARAGTGTSGEEAPASAQRRVRSASRRAKAAAAVDSLHSVTVGTEHAAVSWEGGGGGVSGKAEDMEWSGGAGAGMDRAAGSMMEDGVEVDTAHASQWGQGGHAHGHHHHHHAHHRAHHHGHGRGSVGSFVVVESQSSDGGAHPHSLAMALKDGSVYCYACDDWVLSDGGLVTECQLRLRCITQGVPLTRGHMRMVLDLLRAKSKAPIPPPSATATGAAWMGGVGARPSGGEWDGDRPYRGLTLADFDHAIHALIARGDIDPDRLPAYSKRQEAEQRMQDMIDTAITWDNNRLLMRCFRALAFYTRAAKRFRARLAMQPTQQPPNTCTGGVDEGGAGGDSDVLSSPTSASRVAFSLPPAPPGTGGSTPPWGAGSHVKHGSSGDGVTHGESARPTSLPPTLPPTLSRVESFHMAPWYGLGPVGEGEGAGSMAPHLPPLIAEATGPDSGIGLDLAVPPAPGVWQACNQPSTAATSMVTPIMQTRTQPRTTVGDAALPPLTMEEVSVQGAAPAPAGGPGGAATRRKRVNRELAGLFRFDDEASKVAAAAAQSVLAAARPELLSSVRRRAAAAGALTTGGQPPSPLAPPQFAAVDVGSGQGLELAAAVGEVDLAGAPVPASRASGAVVSRTVGARELRVRPPPPSRVPVLEGGGKGMAVGGAEATAPPVPPVGAKRSRAAAAGNKMGAAGAAGVAAGGQGEGVTLQRSGVEAVAAKAKRPKARQPRPGPSSKRPARDAEGDEGGSPPHPSLNSPIHIVFPAGYMPHPHFLPAGEPTPAFHRHMAHVDAASDSVARRDGGVDGFVSEAGWGREVEDEPPQATAGRLGFATPTTASPARRAGVGASGSSAQRDDVEGGGALPLLPPMTVPTLPRRLGILPGRTGMRNMGNTCYLAATMQALGHINRFRAFFRDFCLYEWPSELVLMPLHHALQAAGAGAAGNGNVGDGGGVAPPSKRARVSLSQHVTQALAHVAQQQPQPELPRNRGGSIDSDDTVHPLPLSLQPGGVVVAPGDGGGNSLTTLAALRLVPLFSPHLTKRQPEMVPTSPSLAGKAPSHRLTGMADLVPLELGAVALPAAAATSTSTAVVAAHRTGNLSPGPVLSWTGASGGVDGGGGGQEGHSPISPDSPGTVGSADRPISPVYALPAPLRLVRQSTTSVYENMIHARKDGKTMVGGGGEGGSRKGRGGGSGSSKPVAPATTTEVAGDGAMADGGEKGEADTSHVGGTPMRLSGGGLDPAIPSTIPPPTGNGPEGGGAVLVPTGPPARTTAPAATAGGRDGNPLADSLSLQVASAVRLLWSGRWSVFTPAGLVYGVWRNMPQFRSYSQQDAQEFVNSLLDALHEELLRGGVPAGATATSSFVMPLAPPPHAQPTSSVPLSLPPPPPPTSLPALAPTTLLGMLKVGTPPRAPVTAPIAPAVAVPVGQAHAPALDAADDAVALPPQSRTQAAAVPAVLPSSSMATSATSRSGRGHHHHGGHHHHHHHAHRHGHHGRRGHHAPPTLSSLPRFPQSMFIADTFGGSTVTQVTCTACRNVTCRVEPFHVLSVSMPPSGDGRGAFSYASMLSSSVYTTGTTPTPSTGTTGISLFQCLAVTTLPETLEGESAYFCDVCASKQTASKQLLLHKLPHALVMHVNRAQWGLRNTGRKEKVQTHVPFPTDLRPADLRPFLSQEGVAAYCEGDDVDAPALYRLKAVVMHQGRGIDTGHYTAYCYDDDHDAWLLFDDQTVSVRTQGEVLKAQAYLLFYEQQEAPTGHVKAGSSGSVGDALVATGAAAGDPALPH